MAQITYDEVNLMLRLYDMRRESRLRQARAWFVENFHPESPEEMMQRYPQGSEENTYIRMVISYWDMVAGIVNRGLINDELFFDSARIHGGNAADDGSGQSGDEGPIGF